MTTDAKVSRADGPSKLQQGKPDLAKMLAAQLRTLEALKASTAALAERTKEWEEAKVKTRALVKNEGVYGKR
jgi:hypothetical protein